MRRTPITMATALGGIVLLSGCASAGQTSEPAASDQGQAIDALLCEQFGDVLTITNNTDQSLREDRMAQQEHAGWRRLATRVLDRLETGDAPTVGPIVEELKAIAPAVPMGAVRDVDGFSSDDWFEQQDELMTACEAVGRPLASEGFVGG